MFIEALLRPTQSQSDEPSDLRGSLSPTTRHRCTMSYCIRHLAVPCGHPSNYKPGVTLLNFSDRADTDENAVFRIFCCVRIRIYQCINLISEARVPS